ncbi:accessory Sec system protein Asp3 [Staphylococcus borealis]|uniref:accessory Sec system protein Asp3 n=1 Tax=Staphylococcus borealis TaxID=2742203 RepID=UPI000FF26CCE|nr:accessory Sec system protein Asp3 [Staphylococcus borealis]MDM7862406.1 accessory Sec system protein Asp3 [Staphylococcus borealis]MDM7881217.1 accessory Sec system protein Asp3 [Staphylococcus borealis]RIO92077.1 accessory Sec system protein Asp3 [Staphylococcus haemolyticus]
MSVLNSYTLLWRHINTGTFMYGTKLRFQDEGTEFNNPLMPSGTVIHDWRMLTTFSEHKTVPSLPILKKGYHYNVLLNFDAQPQGSAYIKMTFYRKNDTEHSYLIIKHSDTTFQFPGEAYAYKIELINAGLSHLFFKNIKIQEIGKADTVAHEIVDREVNLDVLNRVIFGVRSDMRGGQNG